MQYQLHLRLYNNIVIRAKYCVYCRHPARYGLHWKHYYNRKHYVNPTMDLCEHCCDDLLQPRQCDSSSSVVLNDPDQKCFYCLTFHALQTNLPKIYLCQYHQHEIDIMMNRARRQPMTLEHLCLMTLSLNLDRYPLRDICFKLSDILYEKLLRFIKF